MDQLLSLIEHAPDEWQVGLPGAGPLEDLLRRHGRDVVGRLEEVAVSSPRLSLALVHCWLRGPLAPDFNPVADRLEAITAGEQPRDIR